MNMKKIYREIAKKHGVSVEEVRRDMQAAIDEAYRDPTFHAKLVPRAGKQPTPEELIAYLARRIQ